MTSLRPRLSTVSIIPGIETRAPERTETRSGLAASPKPFPASLSTFASAEAIAPRRSPGSLFPPR